MDGAHRGTRSRWRHGGSAEPDRQQLTDQPDRKPELERELTIDYGDRMSAGAGRIVGRDRHVGRGGRFGRRDGVVGRGGQRGSVHADQRHDGIRQLRIVRVG